MPMYAPKWMNKSEKMNDEPVHLGPNLINLQTTSNIKPKWHTKNQTKKFNLSIKNITKVLSIWHLNPTFKPHHVPHPPSFSGLEQLDPGLTAPVRGSSVPGSVFAGLTAAGEVLPPLLRRAAVGSARPGMERFGTRGWSSWVFFRGLPSGKHTKNYGKSQFFMGKSTISMVHFQ